MITSPIPRTLDGLKQVHGTKKICSKLYGSTVEGFIKQDRTDIYNIMCSLVAHDRVKKLNKMMKAVLVIE